MVLDLREMKELKAITLRQDFKKLMGYGFTAKSMSEYMGNQISDRAIREFVKYKRRHLSTHNFEVLNEWTTKVLEEIEKLEEPINYADYYLDAIKGEKNESNT
jgi:ribosomal protein L13E